MDCSDLRRLGPSAASAAITAHLAGCAPCRVLRAGGTALAQALTDRAPAPAAPDFAALAGRLARERGVLAFMRSWPTTARRALVGLVAVGVALLVVLREPRPDLSLYPAARLGIECAVLLGLALPLLFRSLRSLARAPDAPGVVVALMAAAALVPWLAAVAPQAHALHGASNLGTGAWLVPMAVGCFWYGTVCALPALLVAFVLDRGGHRSRERAALAAAGAGLSGLLALSLHCPITARPHLAAGHAPIVIALILAWILVARLRPRARA